MVHPRTKYPRSKYLCKRMFWGILQYFFGDRLYGGGGGLIDDFLLARMQIIHFLMKFKYSTTVHPVYAADVF